VKKAPIAPLDALCRRWLPQNEQQCRRARHSANRARWQELFFAGFDAGGRRAAIIFTLETAKLDDVDGVLSSSLRARRSKMQPKAARPPRASKPPPGLSPQLGADLMNSGPDCQAFVKRSADPPSLPERGGRLVLFGFLRTRFHGAVPLVVRMRILPGGDRLRLRG